MAVTVGVNQEGYLEVTGDDSNDKVVIEERGEDNVEKWVYVGGKLVGGAPFIASEGLAVDLGGGNDSLTIRSGKAGYNDAWIKYFISLGDGDNTFKFETRDVAGSFLLLQSVESGSGKDRVSFKIGKATNSFIGLDGSDAFIDLGAGDDQFSLSWKSLDDSSLSFTSGESSVGVSLGAGNDSAVVTRGNSLNSSRVWFGVDLGGAWDECGVDEGFTNTVKIVGKSTVSGGGESRYWVSGGAGVDKVHYDDERITGADNTVAVEFLLGAGDDVVTVVMDGLRKRGTGIGNDAGDHSYFSFQVGLDTGNDVFKQTFSPKYWRLQNGVTYEQWVYAGEGDDVVSITSTSKSQTLNLDGYFAVGIEGVEGSDAITVSLPNVLRIGPGEFRVLVYGDDSEGETEGDDVRNDVINVNVSFTAASQNSDGAGKGYSAHILVVGQEGDDQVTVTMRNNSLQLGVLVTLDEEGQNDVYSIVLDGLYDLAGWGDA